MSGACELVVVALYQGPIMTPQCVSGSRDRVHITNAPRANYEAETVAIRELSMLLAVTGANTGPACGPQAGGPNRTEE